MYVKRFSTNHEENLKRHQEEAAVSRRTSMDGLHGQRAEEHEACGLHPDSHHKHHRLQLEGSSQGEEGGGGGRTPPPIEYISPPQTRRASTSACFRLDN